MTAWLTGKMALATQFTSWHADTATMEFGARPRARVDTQVSAREPPKIARRPTTSLAPQRVGITMSWRMLDMSVNHCEYGTLLSAANCPRGEMRYVGIGLRTANGGAKGGRGKGGGML